MSGTEQQEEQPIIIKKIIKKAGHGGAHGGAWKVAYADFVTAMMCLFLLLWLVNVDPSVKKTISEFFRQTPIQGGPLAGNVFVFGGAKRPADPGQFDGGASFMQFERKVITEANKKAIAELIKKELKHELEVNAGDDLFNKVDFSLTEDGILIDVKAMEGFSLFQSGSASLTRDAKKILDNLTVSIRKKAAPIIVGGHTDSADYGYGNYDNWDLSSDRANAVRRRLYYSGLSKGRILRVEGYSDTQLKFPDKPLDASNRRITILLMQKDKVESVKPKYLNEDDKYSYLKTEKKYEALIKQDKLSVNHGQGLHKELSSHGAHGLPDADASHSSHLSATAGKLYKPVSLEDLRRQKSRKEFNLNAPAKKEVGGGH